ncbi:MAG: penicillin acylase family protein [Ardenticatenaceae bacterium]|nr:penicillin acylase family protein [Ardenticatenaceae bacterium]HBY96325.1 penicillin acylase family protein [Chloroflexota bacterium]
MARTRLWVRRLLVGVTALLVVLLLVGGIAGWWLIRRPWPQVNGTVKVPGLEAAVEIHRDEWGIPHVYAQNEHDLYFAQGYVHAQDRLWQMDFQRRVGEGRLSEVLGATTLETDKFLRTLGTNRAAVADLANADAETRAVLEAYAAGVNAFIDSRQDRLPLEFTLLGYKPDRWQPVDTLVWGKMMAWNLNGNWEAELFRARVIATLGAARLADLAPGYPANGPLILPGGTNAYRSLGTPNLAAVAAALAPARLSLGPAADGLGSNNWVVSGAKSTTGRPMLANDPHLGIQMPGLWYEVGLHTPDLNVIGASLPGVPGVIIGHNDHIAWGVTNLEFDVEDLYLEKLNPTNPAEYEVEGRFEPFQVVREEIRVKGQSELVQLDVRVGRHGPLINDVVGGLKQPTALLWLTVARPSTILTSVRLLNRAQNWHDFTEALKLWDTPAQNFIYADDQGNIGYYGAGRMPIRAAGTGDVPSPGWDSSHEWVGFVPFEQLPHALNPPAGFIATANNKPVPDSYPFHLGSSWAAPFREQRIITLLAAKEKLSLDDMRAVQADVVPLPARTLVPLLLAVHSDNLIVQRAQEQLREWHERGGDRLDPDLPGAGIYNATYLALIRHLFGDELGPELLDDYLKWSDAHQEAVNILLAEPENSWWDDKTTPARESRDDILKAALADMALDLGRRYGDVPHEWRWRYLHTATFDHPLGSVKPLDRIFNRVLARVPGGDQTPLKTAFRYGHSFEVTSLPSYRQIIDVGQWDNSLFQHTTGQSGQPFHPHYDDMIAPWAAVRPQPMRFSRTQVEAASQGRVLTLEPAQ